MQSPILTYLTSNRCNCTQAKETVLTGVLMQPKTGGRVTATASLVKDAKGALMVELTYTNKTQAVAILTRIVCGKDGAFTVGVGKTEKSQISVSKTVQKTGFADVLVKHDEVTLLQTQLKI